MNLAITGVPLFLFILFSLTVFVFALVVGLLVGVLGATFLFLWGLGGYYILKWANSEGDSKKSDDSGPTIGDRLNSLSGGRLSGFMSSARAEEAKKNISGYNDDNTPAQFNEKTATDATSAATDNVKKATNATGGVQNAVGSTTGTVTGGLGGVTS
jgi:MFS superfamily sulfate permease-like transporter